jgi:hypothetical protein
VILPGGPRTLLVMTVVPVGGLRIRSATAVGNTLHASTEPMYMGNAMSILFRTRVISSRLEIR